MIDPRFVMGGTTVQLPVSWQVSLLGRRALAAQSAGLHSDSTHMQYLTFTTVSSCSIVTALALLITPGALSAQAAASPGTDVGRAPEPLNWTTQQDHKNMMEQLGITRLRPGQVDSQARPIRPTMTPPRRTRSPICRKSSR